jgi:hypothetical protein
MYLIFSTMEVFVYKYNFLFINKRAEKEGKVVPKVFKRRENALLSQKFRLYINISSSHRDQVGFLDELKSHNIPFSLGLTTLHVHMHFYTILRRWPNDYEFLSSINVYEGHACGDLGWIVVHSREFVSESNH